MGLERVNFVLHARAVKLTMWIKTDNLVPYSQIRMEDFDDDRTFGKEDRTCNSVVSYGSYLRNWLVLASEQVVWTLSIE